MVVEKLYFLALSPFVLNIIAAGAVLFCGSAELLCFCVKLFLFFLVCVVIKYELCPYIRKSVL